MAYMLRELLMYFLVLLMLAVSYLIILAMRTVGPITAAIGISALDKLGPEMIRTAIDHTERHELHSLRQLSIMNKVVVYIAGTTAVLIFCVWDKSKVGHPPSTCNNGPRSIQLLTDLNRRLTKRCCLHLGKGIH